MTIAVGFMCTDGMVIAADREVSTPTVKIDEPKAWTFSYPREAESPTLRLGISGAGDYAFIRFTASRIDARVADATSESKEIGLDDVQEIVEDVIAEVHHQHLYPIGQPHERPTIDMLVGISLASGEMRLVSSSLTAVNKVWNYEAAGIGRDLAYFLVKRFYAERIPIASAMFWASYVLMHAKKYVPDCGGESNVIAMFKGGTAGFAQQKTIRAYEQFATDFEAAIHPVLLARSVEGADAEQRFMRLVDDLGVKLKMLRDPMFLQRQTEQVRRDVQLPVHAGNLSVSDGLSQRVITGPLYTPGVHGTEGPKE